MKFVVIMWILTLSNISAEKHVFDGTLEECLLTSSLFNFNHDGKKYSGCYIDNKQYDFVSRD